MSTIKVDSSFISKYVKDKYIHEDYKKISELHEEMRVHSDGVFPEELIGCRRPSESKLLFDYRKKIYESQTIQCFSKIMNSMAKIRKSQDWSIKHPESPASVNKDETLEKYCEQNFPYFATVTNWFFKLALKQYLVDPNAVIAVYPLEAKQDINEYLKPYPVIFNSEQIIDWVDNDYAVLLSLEKNIFTENKRKYEGNIYLIFTTEEIWISKEINTRGDYDTELYYAHNLGFLPCRKIKGEFCEQNKSYTIYKSRLASCLPSWNEAVREYSDMQASVCKHMFPTMVIHTNAKCNGCNGTGKTLQKEGKGVIECETCKGKGSTPTSPYEDIEVRPAMLNEQPLPTPIAYYIDKDTDIIKIQDERIDKHLFKGYAAVNFEFLSVSLNQSGIAKELDRSELNAFIYDVAEDIVDILDSVYFFINEIRYSVVLPINRDKQLPTINVPEKYDIISETYLSDEIAKAKTNKINPFIVNALEIEYANKKFSTDPNVRDLVKLSLELDPLAGMTEDEKMVKLNNGGILKDDYVLSSYIVSFVRRAINEDKDFKSKFYAEQLEVLRKYAKEIVSQTSKVNISEPPPSE